MGLREDTIFALSSGSGRAGVAVVRISGPQAVGAGLCFRGGLPEPRKATVRTIVDKKNDERIDSALIVYFPAPGSFTGENIVEIQCHGGRAVVDRIFDLLANLEGFRAAEAGEFTRRAVENGRLDLTQAEAIADLIDAETEAQRRQALRQHGGELSELYEGWRARLIVAAAWCEASIDFPDEEIPAGAIGRARAELASIHDAIEAHLDDGRRGEILREGLHVAVIGSPNAGKSSLVNALAQRDVAIVSDLPGTTRDVIDVRLNLKGFPVILSDTAGLREEAVGIEKEGVRRAKKRAEEADIRLLVLDGAKPLPSNKAEAEITVFSKSDLVKDQAAGQWISVKTGEGIDGLIDQLTEKAKIEMAGEAPSLTRARHRYALNEALSALAKALTVDSKDWEIVAEEVRRSLQALGRISGRVDLDELLDVVFRDFCIGK